MCGKSHVALSLMLGKVSSMLSVFPWTSMWAVRKISYAKAELPRRSPRRDFEGMSQVGGTGLQCSGRDSWECCEDAEAETGNEHGKKKIKKITVATFHTCSSYFILRVLSFLLIAALQNLNFQ